MRKKKFHFGGKKVSERELIDLINVIPENDQVKIYKYANKLRDQNKFVFEFKKETYEINLSWLEYVKRENNSLMFYAVGKKLMLKVPCMALYQFYDILESNKNLNFPFVHAYTTILFRPVFRHLFYPTSQFKIAEVRNYLREHYDLTYGDKIIKKIIAWLTEIYPHC
ncbi:MAG: hypothetical protein ACRCXV_03550 [Bacteroidales bacterium]